MQAIEQARRPPPESKRRRGLLGQRQQRSVERRVRKRVLAYYRWAVRQGLTGDDIATRLGVSRRTLVRWRTQWTRRRLRISGKGRPACRSPRSLRQGLLALIHLLGPNIGVPTLQALCPNLARREVQDLLRRYRKVWKKRHHRLLRVLCWLKAGSVWAIDFAEPPLPVDGCYGRLLAVRDLASGMQLLWLPVGDETAATVIAALEMLFREHGPPLVLKSDNGSGFIANVTQELLARWQVWHLRSPPEWPAYNGSCEAGIGSMKVRSHHQSVQQGRPGEWTCDDVEAARCQANETARPRGAGGPPPEQAWRSRKPILAAERTAIAAAVAVHETAVLRADLAADDRTSEVAVQRAAISRALVELGLLEYRRGTR